MEEDRILRALYARRRAADHREVPSFSAVLHRRRRRGSRSRALLPPVLAAAAMLALVFAWRGHGGPDPADLEDTRELVTEVMAWQAETDVLLDLTWMPDAVSATTDDP